jgi:hypothetical protein
MGKHEEVGRVVRHSGSLSYGTNHDNHAAYPMGLIT